MKLFLSLILSIGIGALAGFITAGESSGEWFIHLQKPSFQPPDQIFGPVWTTLYILMGISLWLVWKQPVSTQRNNAIIVFMLQLLFNFMWSILFFSWHYIGLALLDILVLWITILLTIFNFAKYSKTAAWLLAPYILWVSFATVLNYTIWRMN